MPSPVRRWTGAGRAAAGPEVATPGPADTGSSGPECGGLSAELRRTGAGCAAEETGAGAAGRGGATAGTPALRRTGAAGRPETGTPLFRWTGIAGAADGVPAPAARAGWTGVLRLADPSLEWAGGDTGPRDTGVPSPGCRGRPAALR
ncbi:hypothetical protein ACIQWN_18125 [Streptomyces vinaceus]|uniref:hypothetical protein n=1 Tax=Streptomyces vinaceus TaxID=1960 RepID=UPI003810C4BF